MSGLTSTGLTIKLVWYASSLSAPRTGERIGSISYSVEGERLNLFYSLKAKPRIQTISLSTTPCTRGGSQPWFICPIRGERVAILYFRAERFACRQCQRLNYASTSESSDARAWRGLRKFEARVGPEYERPRFMRQPTYERILARIDRYNAILDRNLAEAVARAALYG